MPWVERVEPWQRMQVEYCEVTGQLLPRRFWLFEHEGTQYRVRDPGCEELFYRYVLKQRGGRPDRASDDRLPTKDEQAVSPPP
jgi:hypothetical protein